MQLPVNKPLCRLLGWLGLPTVWEVSVGTVLYREPTPGSREYLLLEYPSGHFDFAKGHVEEGESEIETLRRETMEETGLTNVVVNERYRMSITYFYIAKGHEASKRQLSGTGTWIFKTVHFYPAYVASDAQVVISHEHKGFVWCPYRQAVDKATFVNAKKLIVETENTLLQA